jgi:hypothetical protein
MSVRSYEAFAFALKINGMNVSHDFEIQTE